MRFKKSCLFAALAAASSVAMAQAQPAYRTPAPSAPLVSPGTMDREDMREELRDAQEQIRDATQVVQRMKNDPAVAQALQRAQGVFIVTAYGRAALGVGVQGGEGVLITRQGDSWANPVFYNMGGITVGPQAGASGGPMAFMLMTPEAVRQFRSDNNVSLSAEAGLTIAPWSAKAMASTGKLSDVYVWSGTAGLYGGANLGLQGIVADSEANRAYYATQAATPARILGGQFRNPRNDVLAMVLAV
ncbi:lipid-binding SYLF domain-containing protein [Ramlibacter rhizophilus]|nr:lipid-binding SYLF domain-containing protein [Ramlibacter rhizophilus]